MSEGAEKIKRNLWVAVKIQCFNKTADIEARCWCLLETSFNFTWIIELFSQSVNESLLVDQMLSQLTAWAPSAAASGWTCQIVPFHPFQTTLITFRDVHGPAPDVWRRPSTEMLAADPWNRFLCPDQCRVCSFPWFKEHYLQKSKLMKNSPGSE